MNKFKSFQVNRPVPIQPGMPTAEVVILLGGPNGIGQTVHASLRQILAEGCGILPIGLPGGKQHSYVALCDIFLWHDRQQLLPNLGDMQLDSTLQNFMVELALNELDFS